MQEFKMDQKRMSYRLSNTMSSVGSGLRDNYLTFNRHLMVKMIVLLIKLTTNLRDFCENFFGSEHTPTTRIWRNLQNRAAHSDEGGNIIASKISSIDSEDM